jgi:hypothetical protein
MMKLALDESLLLKVDKPAKYTGNEWNMVRKNPDEVAIRFAFAFPDDYEIGMSHLGMKILYHTMNKRQDTYCERVFFAPWTDMEQLMREKKTPFMPWRPIRRFLSFDLVGFNPSV